MLLCKHEGHQFSEAIKNKTKPNQTQVCNCVLEVTSPNGQSQWWSASITYSVSLQIWRKAASQNKVPLLHHWDILLDESLFNFVDCFSYLAACTTSSDTVRASPKRGGFQASSSSVPQVPQSEESVELLPLHSERQPRDTEIGSVVWGVSQVPLEGLVRRKGWNTVKHAYG